VGENFVVLPLEEYQQEQETLYVLNNNSLMGQLEKSFLTYQKKRDTLMIFCSIWKQG